jgi:hypothetical protein
MLSAVNRTLLNAVDLFLFFSNQNITLYIQSERKTNIYVTALFTLKFFTVYNLQFTIYSLQFTVYNLQFTIYSLQFTVYNLRYSFV